jgi:hypothetical protein
MFVSTPWGWLRSEMEVGVEDPAYLRNAMLVPIDISQSI